MTDNHQLDWKLVLEFQSMVNGKTTIGVNSSQNPSLSLQ